MAQRTAAVVALTLLIAALDASAQAPPAQHGTLPAVSPDGRHVAFISTRDGQPDLYVIDADGSVTQRLTSTADNESRPVWAADGREIFVSRTADGSSTLSAIAYPGGSERVVTNVPGRLPQQLANGRVLYATTDWTSMQLMSAAPDGSGGTRVSDGVGAIWGASVSAQGDRVAFGRNAGSTLQVFTMTATGEDVRAVGPFEGRAQMPAWSADGTRLALQVDTKSAEGSQARLWVIDLGTGVRRELAGGAPHRDEVPSWFPDGRRPASAHQVVGSRLVRGRPVQEVLRVACVRD
jgi:Tol biopolymer transport system component